MRTRPGPSDVPRRSVLVLAAPFALALGLQVLPYQLDDAFIAFRFADQFAQGHGIVWNRGGPWVEGFSSPLWFLGLSFVSFVLGSSALPLAAPVAGCASLLLCLLLASRVEAAVLGRALCVALLASLVPAVYYAVTGLETVLFLLVALVYVSATLGRMPLGLGLLAGFVATWVRPEGPWLFVCQLAAVLVAKEPLRSRRNLWLLAALALGAVSLVLLRLALFGSLLPNTFYAKPPLLPAGPSYVLEVLASPWAASLCLLALFGASVGSTVHRAFFAAGVAWIGAPLIEGGDWMPCGRFLLPTFGFFCLASAGAFDWARQLKQRIVVAALSGVVIVCSVVALNDLAALAQSDLESIVHEQRALADWLRRSRAASVALVDVGEVGYRTPIEIVDLAGLTDPKIARARGTHLHKQGLSGYVLGARRPDVVILRVNGATPRDDERVLREVSRFAIAPVERELAKSAHLHEHYELAFAMLPADARTPFYGRVLYVRRGFEIPEAAKPSRRILYLEPLRL